MILGLGCDIVKINRLRTWLKNPSLLQKYFASEEQARLTERDGIITMSHRNLEILASQLAAKESFIKAVAVSLPLSDIIIQRSKTGVPIISARGKAMTRIIQMGVTSIFLSISHEREYAIASVLLEGL